ncbi:MAG: hypothetical protein QW275_01070, partial [Candidatus Anstonellaceae archaeon]
YELAKENILRYKLFDNIEFHLRDVEKEGFPDIKVDAVFIDIPEPWSVIRHTIKILKKGHPLGSLSPNIEQIQKTKKEIREVEHILEAEKDAKKEVERIKEDLAKLDLPIPKELRNNASARVQLRLLEKNGELNKIKNRKT